jgi:hypothetical protein
MLLKQTDKKSKWSKQVDFRINILSNKTCYVE